MKETFWDSKCYLPKRWRAGSAFMSISALRQQVRVPQKRSGSCPHGRPQRDSGQRLWGSTGQDTNPSLTDETLNAAVLVCHFSHSTSSPDR